MLHEMDERPKNQRAIVIIVDQDTLHMAMSIEDWHWDNIYKANKNAIGWIYEKDAARHFLGIACGEGTGYEPRS